jgi:hypothetical protein
VADAPALGDAVSPLTLSVLGVPTVPRVPGVLVPRVLRVWVLTVLAVLVVLPAPVTASERYALIVTGATGEAVYADQYAQWRQAASVALIEKLAFDPSRIQMLFEGGDEEHTANAAAVRRAIENVRARMTPDDVLLILLIGHGSFDGVEAKFNLVGPDLSGSEWGALLKPLPGRVVVIDSTAASFPFLERLAAPRRIVVTATDSAMQRFDTVFPEYFIRALTDPGADIDKNGRVSIWEAFTAASLGVRRHYTQRGQLATERALLDDDGDGVGREAGGDGKDGSASSRLYLDTDSAGAVPTDEALLALLQKRAALQIDADDLKQRRQLMTPDEYQAEFEKLMIDLARVSRDIRRRQKT